MHRFGYDSHRFHPIEIDIAVRSSLVKARLVADRVDIAVVTEEHFVKVRSDATVGSRILGRYYFLDLGLLDYASFDFDLLDL